jgi:hypothetical protein
MLFHERTNSCDGRNGLLLLKRVCSSLQFLNPFFRFLRGSAYAPLAWLTSRTMPYVFCGSKELPRRFDSSPYPASKHGDEPLYAESGTTLKSVGLNRAEKTAYEGYAAKRRAHYARPERPRPNLPVGHYKSPYPARRLGATFVGCINTRVLNTARLSVYCLSRDFGNRRKNEKDSQLNSG